VHYDWFDPCDCLHRWDFGHIIFGSRYCFRAVPEIFRNDFLLLKTLVLFPAVFGLTEFPPSVPVYLRPFHAMLFRRSFISRVHHVSCCSRCPFILCASTRSPLTLACATTSVFPLIHRLSYSIFFSRGFTFLGLHPEDGRCKLLGNSIACTLIYMMSYPKD